MKKFLHKLIFPEPTARSCFSALILLLTGFWIGGTIFIFCDGIRSIGNFIFSVICWCNGDKFNGDIPIQMIFILAGIVMLLYWLWCCRLLFSVEKRWYFSAALLIWIFFSAGAFFAEIYLIWLVFSVLLWGFGGLLINKNAWQAVIIHGILFCLLALCGYQIWQIAADNTVYGLVSMLFLESAADLPMLILTFLLLVVLSAAAAGWQYCAVTGCRWREIITLPVKIMIVSVVIFHISLIAAAKIVQLCGDAAEKRLAEYFNAPISAEALAELHCRRQIDGEFWRRFDQLAEKCADDRELFYSEADFSYEQLALWRKKFESSEVYSQIDQLISVPLAAYPRKFARTEVMAETFPDFARIRLAVRCQQWRIRFALADNDRQAVLTALRNLDNLNAYLDEEPLLIALLVKQMINSTKLQCLEKILAARILDENDLLALQEQLRCERAKMPQLERRAIWGELVMSTDWISGFADGYRNWWDWEKMENANTLAMKKFRFMFPQGWLLYESNRLYLLKKYYGVECFADCKEVESDNIFSWFAQMLTPSYQSAGRKFRSVDLQMQCAEFFIEQELFRLKHGRYPDTVSPPIDPFSGKPMKYTCGEITVVEKLFDGESREITFSGRQLSQIESVSEGVSARIVFSVEDRGI